MGVWWCWTRVRQNISSSRTGQNHWHPGGHYTWLDRTRHYGHQWLLGCVPQSRVTGFHAPHRQALHPLRRLDTGAHTNTIESTWRVVNVFLSQYNRGEDYEYHLVQYMFLARCRAQGVPPFLQLLHLVANTDWNICDVPPILTASRDLTTRHPLLQVSDLSHWLNPMMSSPPKTLSRI